MQPAFIQLKWGLMMKKLHVSSLTSQFLEEILIIQQDGFHHLKMFIKLILLEPISNKRMLLEPEWFSGTGEEFMAAQARFLPEQMDANEASLMAEKSAVEFAMDYSFRHVRLEGDAHYTVDTLIDSDEDLSILYWYLTGSQAHMVGQYAINVKDEDEWFIKEPEFLGDILLSDAISDHSTISPALS